MKIIIALFSLLLTVTAWADIDAHNFQSPEQEKRYRDMIAELRCPKCQNANISDSDAPLARDLRSIVYEKVTAGESDAAIRDFMQQRYGDFILYQPPVKPTTWLLWFGPVVLLGMVFIGIRRWLKMNQKNKALPLSESEQQRLRALLKEGPSS